MSVTLATTYHPRGELARLQRLYPLLQAVYGSILISLPPVAQPADVEVVRALPSVRAWVNDEWAHGRYMALNRSLETACTHVHYADMDRLLRWVETRPDEWRATVRAVQESDCLVIGRTEQAWETHPRALYQTERIYNLFFSHLLGVEVDLGAGSKGFSRRAVEVLAANAEKGRALGADAEWVILLHRAGFAVETRLVDGLDYESADRYADQAADAETQRRAADAYDAEAQNWQRRVEVTLETVESGLDALRREMIIPSP